MTPHDALQYFLLAADLLFAAQWLRDARLLTTHDSRLTTHKAWPPQ